jgi:hypothetical protein
LAWDGQLAVFGGDTKERYWAIRRPSGNIVVTFLNDRDRSRRKRITGGGIDVTLTAPARSIVCADREGKVIEILSLPY